LRTDATLTSGSYTNLLGDRYVYIGAGSARTNRLFDAASSTNGLITIKDAVGHAAGTNLIVAGLFGQTIDGSATYTISTAYGAVTLQAYGTNWAVVSKY
jgi:aromatic ring hydroxylase